MEENTATDLDEIFAPMAEATGAPQAELDIPPLPPLAETPLGEEFVDEVMSVVAKEIQSIEETLPRLEEAYRGSWVEALKVARQMDRGFCERMRLWLNGDGDSAPQRLARRIDHLSLRRFNLPLTAQARFMLEKSGNESHLNVGWLDILLRYEFDARLLEQAATLVGATDAPGDISRYILYYFEDRRADEDWQFFAEHPELLDAALNHVTDRPGDHTVDAALHVLAAFPSLPSRYVPKLAEFATGAKAYRRRAQNLLQNQPDIVAIAASSLNDGRPDVRAASAAWLARVGDPTAIGPLRAALGKEKRESPQAAMLNALAVLGDDISAYLTPDGLLDAAQKGLASKEPAGMAWFPLDGLPSCHWLDGTPVDAQIVRWWCVLSVKLKDPLGAGLIPVYVSLLDETSRDALGRFALDAWIAHDTTHPSDAECLAHAAAEVDKRYEYYQRYAHVMPAQGAMTKEQVFEELRREKGREYTFSAIGEKGLLALTTGAPGHYVHSAVQRYVRDHAQRRAQIEALVTAAAGNPDPAAIQLVLSVARKFRQETVRLKAVELAEDIAERAGWSTDELADRTIPTAGFDESGVLVLDYGPRQFTGRIARSAKTGAFTVEVFDPDGKAITALPKPSASDDDEAANEARKQLTTSKKELTQVAGLQTDRLFEAMCLERTWDAPSWREFLLGHPVMAHLVSTLVWQAWSKPGTYRLFRPTVDAELLGLNDEPVVLADDDRVGFAHASTMTAQESDAWRRHLAEFKIEPLFSQFDPSPEVAGDAKDTNDHSGWLSDSSAIHTRATKRGYSRWNVEDGWFREYAKQLAGSGIRIVISFTGAFISDGRVAASVKSLRFEKDNRPMLLADVPKILLAESYADYVYLAEAGTFDPDWEKNSEF